MVRSLGGTADRPECDHGKFDLIAMMLRPQHEIDDLGAHENPSQTATATRPANANDIRYAVMLASLFRHESKMRHDQAIISGANPIPPGAIRMADRCGG